MTKDQATKDETTLRLYLRLNLRFAFLPLRHDEGQNDPLPLHQPLPSPVPAKDESTKDSYLLNLNLNLSQTIYGRNPMGCQ
jgi:hypothetical protein